MQLKQAKCLAAALFIASLVAFGTGCKNNNAPVLDPMITSDQNAGSQSGGTTGTGGLPEIDENTIFGDAGLANIYFDYNSFALRPDALATLDRNATMLRNVPNVMVQIEGHCDERGTQEYNLALGEKRALATREHLVKLGIPADRIITISYGEEMPAVPGTDESAYAQNRRCEFNRAM